VARAPKARWLPLALALASFCVFAGAVRNDFVNFDDGDYVYANPRVKAGLSSASVAWAFTTRHAFNWHPLTWLSHQLDVELYGLRPGLHHLTSVALHAATVAILFVALFRLTGARWRSAFAAALFGLHPLRVESVAWIAERKDVLALLFGALAILLYERYARAPSAPRLAAVAFAFSLGLLAKPVLVTLPCALLLLDHWPLGRTADPALGATSRQRLARLVLEKAPLFVLAAGSCVVTSLAQSPQAATTLLRDLPGTQRLANATVATSGYLLDTLLPVKLAVFYPHPWLLGEKVPAAAWSTAAALLAAVSIVAALEHRCRPWLAVGWLWFLGTLVPMLGFFRFGYQASADRYTYLPSIGLAVAFAWALGELATRFPARRRAIALSAGVVLALLALASVSQVRRWRNSETLYAHALAVTERNWLAAYNLAIHRLERGDTTGALAAFRQSSRALPGLAPSWYGAGVALASLGRHAEAAEALGRAARLTPNDARTLRALSEALIESGRWEEAAAVLERTARLTPGDEVVRAWLARAHERLGRRERAPEP
jgi:hypothetical protein